MAAVYNYSAKHFSWKTFSELLNAIGLSELVYIYFSARS